MHDTEHTALSLCFKSCLLSFTERRILSVSLVASSIISKTLKLWTSSVSYGILHKLKAVLWSYNRSVDFNLASSWSKVHSGLVKVTAPGAWFRKVLLSLLINRGCVLWVPSPIPGKNQVCSHLGRLLLLWWICQVIRNKLSAGETICKHPGTVGANHNLDYVLLK